jgi:hypothetical protein
MVIDWYAEILHLIINVIIISPVLWLAGRGLVGKEKAKFTDAVWIVALGTIIGMIIGFISADVISFSGIVIALVELIVWLGLIKHFFDCGWLMALAIGIIAIIFFIIIAVILALLGYALFQFVPQGLTNV